MEGCIELSRSVSVCMCVRAYMFFVYAHVTQFKMLLQCVGFGQNHIGCKYGVFGREITKYTVYIHMVLANPNNVRICMPIYYSHLLYMVQRGGGTEMVEKREREKEREERESVCVCVCACVCAS
jgi:hypothetical protein